MQPNHYKSIFGWFDFEDVYDRAVAEALDGAVFVEVGSFLGKSACYLAEKIRQSGKNIHVFCVDHFRLTDEARPIKEIAEFKAQHGGNIFLPFWKNTFPFRDIITVIPLPSVEAARLLPDGFADFVFIDAGHDEESVNDDIDAWMPKLKAGGMLAGHDYDMREVRQIVDDWFPNRKLMNRCWLSREFDELVIFGQWYTQHASSIPRCPIDNLNRVGEFVGQTIYRDGPFQVQVWSGPGGAEVKDHRHPGVDTVQIYLSGQIYLRINGEEIITPEMVTKLPDGSCSLNGSSIRIRPTDYHGFRLGPMGGSWMTIERWLAGEPSSTELSWEGEPIDEEHRQKVEPRLPVDGCQCCECDSLQGQRQVNNSEAITA